MKVQLKFWVFFAGSQVFWEKVFWAVQLPRQSAHNSCAMVGRESRIPSLAWTCRRVSILEIL